MPIVPSVVLTIHGWTVFYRCGTLYINEEFVAARTAAQTREEWKACIFDHIVNRTKNLLLASTMVDALV